MQPATPEPADDDPFDINLSPGWPYLERRRHGRSGPKSATAALLGTVRGRIATAPPVLDLLQLPYLYEGDQPWMPPRRRPDEPGRRLPRVYTAGGYPVQHGDDTEGFLHAFAEHGGPRRVARTILYRHGARYVVSTIFTGADAGDGEHQDPPMPPVLWETMIFRGYCTGVSRATTGHRWAYMSLRAAIRGHANILRILRAAWRAEDGPRVRRTPSTAGPWRHGYHQQRTR